MSMKWIQVLAATALALSPALAAADSNPVPGTPPVVLPADQTTGGVADKTKSDDDDKLGYLLTPEGVAIGALAIGAAVVIGVIASQNGRNSAATNTN